MQTAIGNIGQKWVDSHNGDTLVIRLSESAGIFVSNTEPPVQLQSQQALENMVSRGYTVMTVESLLGISSLEQNPNIVFSSSVDGRSMTGQVVSMDNFGLHNLNEVVDLAEEFNPGISIKQTVSLAGPSSALRMSIRRTEVERFLYF